MSWHVDFTNGDLFAFKTEAEARAFFRGFQYAKRLATEAAIGAAVSDRNAVALIPARNAGAEKLPKTSARLKL